jgi:hypothetical protein
MVSFAKADLQLDVFGFTWAKRALGRKLTRATFPPVGFMLIPSIGFNLSPS